ncbi:MAG: UDP-N-acetylglucosamine 1-carboxyvinyltransferase [bacterium]
MNGFKVRGGASLHGVARVGGSKNAALALLAGALCVEGEVVLHNFPAVSDVLLMVDLLRLMGVKAERNGDTLWMDVRGLNCSEPPENYVRKMRASFYLMGPLLARLGRAKMPVPGGCQIGTRPVDYHIKGLHQLGAEITQTQGAYEAVASQLVGAEIYFDFPSAGATQHLMTAAVLAEGNTLIQHAAMEPEVLDLAYFLNRMGARIEGAGTNTITIQGVRKLQGGEYSLISDRVQAGSYLLAGAITHGDVTVEGVHPEHLQPLNLKMRECGVNVTEGNDWVRVQNPNRHNATDITTMPFPGFPTDLQQPMCAFLTLANGASVVREQVYDGRNKHVGELQRMGADIKATDGRTFIINGVDRLTAARVEAHDLRGGAAMIIAALAAEGESLVSGAEYVDRGYQGFEEALNNLGGSIERVALEAEDSAVVSSTP